MRVIDLDTDEARRASAVVLDTGDEAIKSLAAAARAGGWGGSQLTAIGAFERVVLGYFDWTTKSYRHIPIDEQVEVLALTGDVTIGPDGSPAIHAHVVVGKRDGTAHGGHLLEGHVRPTLEVIVTESPVHLVRQHDPTTGLSLIRRATAAPKS